jgi:hypothetical protein
MINTHPLAAIEPQHGESVAGWVTVGMGAAGPCVYFLALEMGASLLCLGITVYDLDVLASPFLSPSWRSITTKPRPPNPQFHPQTLLTQTRTRKRKHANANAFARAG